MTTETPIAVIDYRNFTLGEGIHDRLPDKGFSPQSYGLNLTKEKGTLYMQESGTNRGASVLVNYVVAATYDPEYLGQDTYVLDKSGNYYTLSGSTFTKRQTDSTNTYAIGDSDLIKFKTKVFGTSASDIAYLSGDTLTSIDKTWWSSTRGHGSITSSYRHPMEVVEDTLYIGDVNNIHTWDGTTSVSQAMQLPTGVNITSLRKHPDGQHLIAFCGVTANYSHQKAGGGRIYLIDTVNLEWIREIETESQVEGSINVGGIIYTTYGAKIGYFNGDGITYLRDLNDAVTYSHNLGNVEDILIVREGTKVLAYGDLGQGKVWWKCAKGSSIASANSITNVQYKGDNKILISYLDGSANPYLEEIDLDNAAAYGVFYSNRLVFQQEMAIRRIEIEHTKTNASGTDIMIYELTDGATTPTTLFTETVTYASNPNTKTRLDLDAFGTDFQLNIALSSAIGFRQIRIYGEPIE